MILMDAEGETHRVKCQKCGKIFWGTSHARFCDQCREERHRECMNKGHKKVVRECESCGEPFETYDNSKAKYCKKCAKKLGGGGNRLFYGYTVARERNNKRQSRIDQHAAAAKNLGISYGAYMAMLAGRIKI